MKSQINNKNFNSKQKQFQFPIKCYLKLYPNNGLANPYSHPPKNYQILDQNTLLRKKQDDKGYQMLKYSKIFSARISNTLMSKHLNFIDDLQQGINHTTIAIVNSNTKKFFTTGTFQHRGMFIQYFLSIYYDFKNQYVKKHNKLCFSIFATVGNKPNQYIDLLTGQRYTFLSKKDVDSAYKTFFQRKIQSLQEYLIALKMATIRYQQCCDAMDFIVYRISIENQDQFTQAKGLSTGNVVICHHKNKYLEILLKYLQNLFQCPGSSKGSDHGSLFSCLQPYLKNGKVSIIQTFLNEYDQLQENLPQIRKMLNFLQKKATYKINCQNNSLQSFIKQLQNLDYIPSNFLKSQLTNISTKQFQKIRSTFFAYKIFVKDTSDKIQAIFKFYKQFYEIREQFYQKVRFPISLQIKRSQDPIFTIKAYYIAKIYSLSQKFQMQDMQSICQKMTTIKNQVQISLKSMLNAVGIKKKMQKLNQNQSSITLNQNHMSLFNPSNKIQDQQSIQKQSKTEKYEKFLKLMRNQLQRIKKNLKYTLNLNSRYINQVERVSDQIIYQIDLIDLPKFFCHNFTKQIERSLKQYSVKAKQSQQQKLNGDRHIIRQLPKINQTESYLTVNNPRKNRIIFFHQNQKGNTSMISRQEKSNQKVNKSQIIRKTNKKSNQTLTLQNSLLKVKQSQMLKQILIRSQIIRHKQNELEQRNSQKKQLQSVQINKTLAQINRASQKGGKQNGIEQNQKGQMQIKSRDYYLAHHNSINLFKGQAQKIPRKSKQSSVIKNSRSQVHHKLLEPQFPELGSISPGFVQKQRSTDRIIQKKDIRNLKNKIQRKVVINQIIEGNKENSNKRYFPQINVVCRKIQH